MTVAPQAEVEIVHGTIVGITQKGADKWQVAVQQPGSQYAKNLWSKDAGLIGQLSLMIGQETSFMCGISNWTNQSGQPVRSLWINGVGAGETPAPQPIATPQPIPMPTPQPILPATQQPTVVTVSPAVTQAGVTQQRVLESERETRIMRQTASKVAGILISHVPSEQRTLENVLDIAERLVAYYEHGVGWQQDSGPMPDDSIPF